MVKRLVKAMAALAAAAVFLGASAAAQVPDPYARQLAQRLSRAEQLVTEYGYSRAAGPFAGGLGQGLARGYQVTLRAGQDYRIVGVCEERCRDLDLRLLDSNGNLVAQDVLRDAVPVIHVQPRATGVHTIEVLMPGCGAPSPCFFAFNVYAR